MTPDQFIELMREMREAQKAFFKNKGIDALSRSKRLEAQVDAEIRGQKGLPL